MKKNLLLLVLCMSVTTACTKAYVNSKTVEPRIYKHTFATNPNEIYYALRWALKTYGYPIAEEDLQNGVIKTRYVPVTPTSHYIAIFKRQDYGANGAYHQLEVRLVPHDGKTEVQIGSRMQTIVTHLQSSGREEQMILEKVADYLRSPNVQLTNLGVQE